MELFYFIPTDGVFVEHKDKKKKNCLRMLEKKESQTAANAHITIHARGLFSFWGCNIVVLITLAQ